MFKHKTHHQTNILKRQCTLFAIIVLPVIIIGIYLQIQINHSTQNNTLSSVSDRITDSIQSIDQNFLYSSQLSASLFGDNRMMRIANPDDPMSPYEVAVNVNNARKLLTSIKISNEHISNVRLYLPQKNLYYNADRVFDYTEKRYLGSQGDITPTMSQDLQHFQKTGELQIHDGSLSFFQYSSINAPLAITEITYMIPDLKAIFSQTLLFDDSLYFFHVTPYNYLISNQETYSLPNELLHLSDKSHTKLTLENKTYYAFQRSLLDGNATYIQLIPDYILFQSIGFSNKYLIGFISSVLLCAACFVLISLSVIQRPVKELTYSLQQVEENNYDITLADPSITDFQSMYNAFNRMSARLRQFIQNELQYELLLNQAQLKQLQAQINPHFLYNSFFMLKQMIAREMYDEANELANELGDYFKYITRNYNDEMSLAEEYSHTKIYADIQAKRFVGRIRIQLMPLPGRYASLSVPRLILQPLLENAFKYGLENKIRDGLLKISFAENDDHVTILVEDNGDNLTDENLIKMQESMKLMTERTIQTETTGFLNIYKRLLLYYKRDGVMSLSRSPLGGLQVSIHLFFKED